MRIRQACWGLTVAAAVLSAGCCHRRCCWRPFGGRFAHHGCEPCCPGPACYPPGASEDGLGLAGEPYVPGPPPRPVLAPDRSYQR
jgi:hypothetical protein